MTQSDSPARGVDRRTVLRAAGAATAAAALGASATRASAASDPTLEEWFANVDNYDGVVNKTGLDEVVVAVGADGNGGAFAYGPAAVRVDPGTTVVWEWTGEGGAHDVAASDGLFASPLTDEAGATFERTFDGEGTTLFACTPHEPLGMKGAVVVGDAPAGEAAAAAEPDYGDWFADVDNYESTVDARGTEEVRVAVGAEGNGGAFAFDPPAVHVDPGTTVVWEWTGDGGTHDVVDSDGAFAADPAATAGHTFALTFDGDGVSTYSCKPHEAVGMKGAVVVGEYATAGITVGPEVLAVGGALLAAVLSPLAFLAFLVARGVGGGPGRGRTYYPGDEGTVDLRRVDDADRADATDPDRPRDPERGRPPLDPEATDDSDDAIDPDDALGDVLPDRSSLLDPDDGSPQGRT